MFVVKKIEISDLEKVIIIHNLAFSNFFLTKLGPDFLKLYYKTVSEHKEGVLLGYYDDNNELCGFCAATTLSLGFNKRLIKSNFFAFSFFGLKFLLTKPLSLVRLFKNLTKSNSQIKDNATYGELLSICINPKEQGLGVGKKLLEGLEIYLLSKGVKNLSLTTDFYNNEKGLHFYVSMDYKIMYDFIAYPNRKMYRLIKKL